MYVPLNASALTAIISKRAPGAYLDPLGKQHVVVLILLCQLAQQAAVLDLHLLIGGGGGLQCMVSPEQVSSAPN